MATELFIASELMDKVLTGEKRTTIRKRGKVGMGDFIIFRETIGDMWTIGREGHLIAAVAKDMQPRTCGPLFVIGVFGIKFSPDHTVEMNGKILEESAMRALCSGEGLSEKDLFKFIQLCYGFDEPLELILWAEIKKYVPPIGR